MAKALKNALIAVVGLVVLVCAVIAIPPFPEAKISRLSRGMTTNEVINVFGNPSERLDSRWYYSARLPSFETLILWFDGTSRLEGWTID